MRHVCQTVRGCRDCYCYVRTLQLGAATQNKHYSDRVFCIMRTGVDAVKITTVLHLNEVKDNECVYFEMIISTDS